MEIQRIFKCTNLGKAGSPSDHTGDSGQQPTALPDGPVSRSFLSSAPAGSEKV